MTCFLAAMGALRRTRRRLAESSAFALARTRRRDLCRSSSLHAGGEAGLSAARVMPRPRAHREARADDHPYIRLIGTAALRACRRTDSALRASPPRAEPRPGTRGDTGGCGSPQTPAWGHHESPGIAVTIVGDGARVLCITGGLGIIEQCRRARPATHPALCRGRAAFGRGRSAVGSAKPGSGPEVRDGGHHKAGGEQAGAP